MSIYAQALSSNPWRVAPGGGDTAASLLADARRFLDRIEDEVHRLSAEVFELRTSGTVLGFLVLGPLGFLIDDPTGLEEQASAYEAMIEQLEHFVGDVFNRVEQQALAGDIDAARRLRDSTARIAGAAAAASPVDELADNIKKTVDDAVNDLKVVSKAIATLTTVVIVAAAANFVSNLIGRRR